MNITRLLLTASFLVFTQVQAMESRGTKYNTGIFLNVPKDVILTHILSQNLLDFSDLKNFSDSCQYFNGITQDLLMNHLIKNSDKVIPQLSLESAKESKERLPNFYPIKSLSFLDAHFFKEMTSYRNLELKKIIELELNGADRETIALKKQALAENLFIISLSFMILATNDFFGLIDIEDKTKINLVKITDWWFINGNIKNSRRIFCLLLADVLKSINIFQHDSRKVYIEIMKKKYDKTDEEKIIKEDDPYYNPDEIFKINVLDKILIDEQISILTKDESGKELLLKYIYIAFQNYNNYNLITEVSHFIKFTNEGLNKNQGISDPNLFKDKNSFIAFLNNDKVRIQKNLMISKMGDNFPKQLENLIVGVWDEVPSEMESPQKRKNKN